MGDLHLIAWQVRRHRGETRGSAVISTTQPPTATGWFRPPWAKVSACRCCAEGQAKEH